MFYEPPVFRIMGDRALLVELENRSTVHQREGEGAPSQAGPSSSGWSHGAGPELPIAHGRLRPAENRIRSASREDPRTAPSLRPFPRVGAENPAVPVVYVVNGALTSSG